MAYKLSPEQVKSLHAAQRALHDVLPDVDRLEKCGEDCREHRTEIDKLRKKLEAFLQHFGSE